MKNFKKNRTAFSTILIVAIVVVIIVVAAAAGAYYALNQNPPVNNRTATPTPGASITPSTSPSSTPNIATASSLQYSISLSESGAVKSTYTYYGKNAGTDNFAMRIEYSDEGDNGIFIFNAGTKKAWTYSGGEWVDISTYFDTQYSTWNDLWSGYVNSLAAWQGTGDYTYTSGSSTVRIYDISVNPALSDSLFTHE
ncbi:MAG TPA: hypothetical protein VLH35_00585 [Candidatus Acidoferrales bacterium]|nr:hypothetical protein [Candidatus Acidoferrales bacterium]